jgi:hypothetical protein
VSTGAVWKVDQKYLEGFEMWCWSGREMVCWTYRVRNGEVLQRVKRERNILQRVKGNWSGHILHWNCLLKHVPEGKIERRIAVKGRQG